MTWPQRLSFAGLSAWLVAAAFMAVTAPIYFGQDFRGYYAAASVLLAGGDPYDYAQVAPVLIAITGRAGNNPFYYPPWFAVMMTPFVLLPYGLAKWVWMAGSLAAWLAALPLVGRVLEWPRGRWGERWWMYLAATFVLAWVTWRFEQVGALIALACLLAVRAAQTDRPWLLGAALALALTKPNATFVFVGALLIWLARRHSWRPLAAFALALAVLVIISSLLMPGWWAHLAEPGFGRGLTEELDGPGRVVAERINTTLLDWLERLGVLPPAAWFVYGMAAFVALAALAWAVFTQSDAALVASVAIAAGFAVTPYALQYDFPPLVLPLFFALRELTARPGAARWLGVGGLAAMISVLFWQRPISDGYWLVLLTAGLLAAALAVRKRSAA